MSERWRFDFDGSIQPYTRMLGGQKMRERDVVYLRQQRALSLLLKAAWGRPPLGKVPIMIQVIFYGPSLYKGDLDNRVKALADAANKILFLDDVYVVEIYARKIKRARPGFTLWLEALDKEPTE